MEYRRRGVVLTAPAPGPVLTAPPPGPLFMAPHKTSGTLGPTTSSLPTAPPSYDSVKHE